MLMNNTFVLNNDMITYKITPDFGVSNSKNEIITNTFANLYEPPTKRLSLANINMRKQCQVHFNIVLENRNASFYLSIPTQYDDLITSKIHSCWKRSALDKVNDSPLNGMKISNTIGGELRLSDYNVNAISTELSDTSHLNSLFQLLRAISGEDKVIINIAIEPMNRMNWLNIIEDESRLIKEGKTKVVNCDFTPMATKSVGKYGSELLGLYLEYQLLPFEVIMGMFNEEGNGLFNIKENDEQLMSKFNEELSPIRHHKSSIFKKNSDVFKCKITILSSSFTPEKARLNLLSTFESFKELNGENEFYLKELGENKIMKRAREIRNFSVSMSNDCILSTKEVAKLIQLPPRQTQRDFKIKAVDDSPSEISKDLLKGDVPMAITTYRGKEFIVYRSQDKSIRCLPIISVGSQNAGKTTLMKRMAYDNFKMGDSNLVIDTIEDCKIAKACREVIPKEGRYDIKLSLDDWDNIPSFSFNEISNLITEDLSPHRRLSYASDIAEQVEQIINFVSDDKNNTLTDAMIRYLYSACLVTFIKPYATLQDVFDVLREPQKRHKAIEYAKHSGCINDDGIYYNLEQLDKYVEVSETVGYDEKGKPIKEKHTYLENNNQAIVGIINRITKLEKVPYVKKMLGQKPNPDENFLKFIEQGKTIVISVPQFDFKSKGIRDMIASYYVSRVWLAIQSRKNNEEANPCHLIFDEVYTVPATIKLLEDSITQFRRHRLGLLTSCHSLAQFGDCLESFKSAGGSFILIQSTQKESFNLLKEELQPFEFSDMMELEEHHAIILQRCADGYSKYVGRLPNFGEDLSHLKLDKEKRTRK